MTDRRLFARTSIEVDGQVQWATKRRIGVGVKSHSTDVTTLDLSVDGAKVLLSKGVILPVGASVRLVFGSESSPARVRRVLSTTDSRKILCLNLEQPSRDFMKVIEQWLAVNAGGQKFIESYWTGEPDGENEAA